MDEAVLVMRWPSQRTDPSGRTSRPCSRRHFSISAPDATCEVSPTPTSIRNLSPLHRIHMHAGTRVSAGNGKIVAKIAAVLLDSLYDPVQFRRRHAIFDGARGTPRA